MSELLHCRLVSGASLRKCVDSLEAVPIDNSDLLCEHGKGHPDKLRKRKHSDSPYLSPKALRFVDSPNPVAIMKCP